MDKAKRERSRQALRATVKLVADVGGMVGPHVGEDAWEAAAEADYEYNAAMLAWVDTGSKEDLLKFKNAYAKLEAAWKEFGS